MATTIDIGEYVWREDASCLGVAYQYEPGSNPFFRERGESYVPARRICGGCPVVIDCLLDGIDDKEGFRGCTTPRERRKVRRAVIDGATLKTAAESVWEPVRKRWVDLAPPRTVWWEWDG